MEKDDKEPEKKVRKFTPKELHESNVFWAGVHKYIKAGALLSPFLVRVGKGALWCIGIYAMVKSFIIPKIDYLLALVTGWIK